MHLCNCNSTFCRDPVLILRSWDICDLTLTVHAHIQYLLERCHKSLNLIKVLSNTNWGPDTKTLLSVLRAQVRSKLDYCIIDYRSPKMSKCLEKLDILHRQGLRL